MPCRAKKRIPLPPDPLKRLILEDVVAHNGNRDTLRKSHHMTRAEFDDRLIAIICCVVLMLWKITIDLIVRQGNTESMLAEMRKPAGREMGRTTAAGNGGRAA